MAFKIVWLPEVNEELYHYLDRFIEQGNSEYVKGLVTALDQVIEQLKQFPQLYPIWRNNIRIAPLSDVPYRLFYAIDRTPETITIVGLQHNRQNREALDIDL